jgi:3-methyl-2-oxobutanoate hydroxymethyltransferase
MNSTSFKSPSPGFHSNLASPDFNSRRSSFEKITDFSKAKKSGQKISMLSIYDAILARLAVKAGVSCLLVGDSVAMVLYGYESTVFATVEMMAEHVGAVRRACPKVFIVADLPFGSYRRGINAAMKAVESLVRAGASAVKLEGVSGNERVIPHIVESGIPVMGHLGLTPQSVLALGGYKVQGVTPESAHRIVDDAKSLEDLGAFSLVLECSSSAVGEKIASSLSIPVIGIGAGAGVDGQVLVASDLLGFSNGPTPRFVRKYLDGETLVANAFAEFVQDIETRHYPSETESYD